MKKIKSTLCKFMTQERNRSTHLSSLIVLSEKIFQVFMNYAPMEGYGHLVKVISLRASEKKII